MSKWYIPQPDELQGVLWKHSPQFPYHSQQRHMLLSGGKLTWSKVASDGNQGKVKGSIDFVSQRCLVENVEGSDVKFTLSPEDGQWQADESSELAFTGAEEGRVFTFSCSGTLRSRQDWVDAIHLHILYGREMREKAAAGGGYNTEKVDEGPRRPVPPVRPMKPEELTDLLWKQMPSFPYTMQKRSGAVGEGKMTWSLVPEPGAKAEVKGCINFLVQSCLVEESGSGSKFTIRAENDQWVPDENFTGADQGRIFTFDSSGSGEDRDRWLEAIGQNILYGRDYRAWVAKMEKHLVELESLGFVPEATDLV